MTTPVVLITVTRVYDGIYKHQARPSTDTEIQLMVDKGFDFQGQSLRIFVYPIGFALNKEAALRAAVHYWNQPYDSLVDWQDYSNAMLTGARTRNEQMQRKKWKGKKNKDRHPQDVSSEGS